MKQLSLLVCSVFMLATAQASPMDVSTLSGDSGSINNNTGYVIECTQVMGGYCANNPMPADGYLQMLPDPGSEIITGHIMVFDISKPGNYIDNILFTYKETGKQWKFETQSLYHKINVTHIKPNDILLTRSQR